MTELNAGFSRVNITPPMGIPMRGYFKPRFADGVLDELEVNVIALEFKNEKFLLISIDDCGVEQVLNAEFRKGASDETEIPMENIILSSTHTHTGGTLEYNSENELIKEYTEFVSKRVRDAARFAVNDLTEAKMGYGKGYAPNVAFIRRYVMKDGSIKTNPGVNNPDIMHPVGKIDDSVNIIRFDRKDADTIIFVNFANHPDVVGGCKISADWPGLLRKTVEKTLNGTKCIFFNGAQGDVNHVNVMPKPGDLNDMFIDFDDVARGYGHAKHIANVVTGGVLQAYAKVNYVEPDSVCAKQKIIAIPSNKASKEELINAHKIIDLHNDGRDSELPYEGMMFTTIVAEAARMVRLENSPDSFEMMLSAIKLGPVAILGIPGEPFSEIGKQIKETQGFDMIIPCCNTNGKEGYFPMQDSYDEGGYEARSSNFKAGVGECIIKKGKELLNDM